MKEKLKIRFKEYHYQCGDGCCDWWKIITYLNDKELECHNEDTATIVKQILEELGYQVDIGYEQE